MRELRPKLTTLLFLILPVSTLTMIYIEVSGEFDAKNPNLTAYLTGFDSKVITDKERTTFKINNEELKECVREYFCEKPTDVYVRSPTPWDDLYDSYGWRQVQRRIEPINATLLGIKTEIETLSEEDTFENDDSSPKYVNMSIKRTVKNSLESKWELAYEFSVKDKITYLFDLHAKDDSFSYNHPFQWGSQDKVTKDITVGAEKGVYHLLRPRQKIIARLQLTKQIITIRIDYETSLSGSVAVNYEIPYQNHHFYHFDITDVMYVKDLDTELTSSQIVEFVFYSNATIVITDYENGDLLRKIAIHNKEPSDPRGAPGVKTRNKKTKKFVLGKPSGA